MSTIVHRCNVCTYQFFIVVKKINCIVLFPKLLLMVHSRNCCYINLSVLQSCAMWINPILQDMLRHIFQSCILESNEEILELIQKVCCMNEQLCVCECVFVCMCDISYHLGKQSVPSVFCMRNRMSVFCAPSHSHFSCLFFTLFMLKIAEK